MRGSSISYMTASVLACAPLINAAALGVRQNSGPNTAFQPTSNAAVGSDEWKSAYPTPFQIANPKPEWLDCLSAAHIPNISKSMIDPVTTYPTYPAGVDASSSGACSWTTKHCFAPDDVYQPMPKIYTATFDDGPVPQAEGLYTFLQSKQLVATHFVIGSNMLTYPSSFQKAIDANQHFGVHTWSHRYLTNLTNEQILGEIGWGLQIIMDMTGGKVPNIYRPPDGDVDNRVRAIAKQCFNLTTVLWNYDTNDWHLTTNNGTASFNLSTIDTTLGADLKTNLNSGLVPLHHELTLQQVAGFTDTYPQALQLGYTFNNAADLAQLPPYANQADLSAPVTPMDNPIKSFKERVSSAASSSSYASTSSSSGSSGSLSSRATSTTSSRSSASSGASSSDSAGTALAAQTSSKASAANHLLPTLHAVSFAVSLAAWALL